MRKLRIIVPIIIALVIGFTAGVTSTQGANVLKGAVIAVLVAKVKAVGQLETGFGKQFCIKALVPINARGVSNIKRIPGVGVSANSEVTTSASSSFHRVSNREPGV